MDIDNFDMFDVMPEQPNIFSVYLNTGTLYDLACGRVEACKNNYVINGGASNIVGVGGRNQTYKSYMIDTFIARILSIYKNVQCVIFDSENSKVNTQRYDNLSLYNQTVSNRIRLYDTTTDDLNTFHAKIKDMVEFKKKHAKDLMIETPFLDETTKKPIVIMLPTLVGIDSFTMATVFDDIDTVQKSQLNDSSLNTIWMKSGKYKTILMRQFVQYARSANIYFFLTAHVGENKDLTGKPYSHPMKQMQFMAQSDRLKDVGSQFQFLCNTYLQTKGVTVLEDKDHNCYYPDDEFNNSVELNRVGLMVARNKINASGIVVPFIVSQYQGLMNNLTHLQYLKDMKDEVLLTGKGNMKLTMYPEVSFSRNNIRNKTQEDLRLERALDLSAQFIFVKNTWSKYKLPVDISLSVEHFSEYLTNHSEMMNDILDSRSYWTYSKDDRSMLTIFDIIDMVNTNKVFAKHVDMGKEISKKKDKKISDTATATSADQKAA